MEGKNKFHPISNLVVHVGPQSASRGHEEDRQDWMHCPIRSIVFALGYIASFGGQKCEKQEADEMIM